MSNIVPRQTGPAAVPFGDMQRLADAIAKSGLFGIKTSDQALALMAIAQAEGRHPALAARDYDIIQGRPSKKAEAMLRDFLEGGGKVEWHELSDAAAEATFSHSAGGSVRIRWDHERVKQAGLNGKDMWRKYPRQMMRSRVVSEGVRTVYPMATSGMYVPEEVADFASEPRDVTPPRPSLAAPAANGAAVTSTDASPGRSDIGSAAISVPHDPATGEILPPHALPAGEDYSPVEWGGRFIAAVRTAATQADIDGWCFQNKGILDDIQQNFPKAWRSIDTAIASAHAAIGPEPEPEMLGADEAEKVLL